MKIFKFLIINFLFINGFNTVASEIQFLGPDNVKTLGKVDPLFTYETLDEFSTYISNVLTQLSKQPIFLNSIFYAGAGRFLILEEANKIIIINLLKINDHKDYVRNLFSLIRRIRYHILFINEKYNLEIAIEGCKKIIEELKYGWKKLPNLTDKTYVIEKNGSKKEFDLLESVIKKFNLDGVGIVYDSDKSRILIKEDILEKAFLAFDFNISYSVEDAEKIEKLKKLLNLIIQNPDKTKSLIPVLSEIVLSYFLTPAYLFKFSPKEIDDFIGSQAIIPNKKSLKRKGSFDKGEES